MTRDEIVAEFEASCEEGGAFWIHGEPSERAVKEWLAAALDRYGAAREREAWGKAAKSLDEAFYGVDHYSREDASDVIRMAALAAGHDLSNQEGK